MAAFLILFLLLCAVLPLRQFLLTIAQDIFADAKRENVCWYLLPCLLLLTMLGAETLVRTSRVLLPVLFLSVLAALAIGIREFRVFRMYPIPLGKPEKLLTDTVSAIQRTFAPLLALLCIGEGTQNTRALQSAGNIGAAFGTVTVLAGCWWRRAPRIRRCGSIAPPCSCGWRRRFSGRRCICMRQVFCSAARSASGMFVRRLAV